MAAREADVGDTKYMIRTYKYGKSLSRRGQPLAKNKAVAMAAVAAFSRSEQTNFIQYKPKELGGMVQGLLVKETAEEAADVDHTTESLAVMIRKADRLAHEIRKGHPDLNTRPISKSIVEEARDRWTTEDKVKKCTARWEAYLLVTGIAELLDEPIVNSKGHLQQIRILYPERIVNLDKN